MEIIKTFKSEREGLLRSIPLLRIVLNNLGGYGVGIYTGSFKYHIPRFNQILTVELSSKKFYSANHLMPYYRGGYNILTCKEDCM